ncbi:MAG: hypothetical protein A2622_01860 [Bdellovibrionales bacterium RIFCSPHIGHO2_01_FULL_40_29]|nr:MAG: hypothetical protein A2622_01860 [Bdellovibrionales bacterium RIFCSPHIGHO2_01_FULL_40_29]OFZ33837.1 MAG: hypothetical protein A3D17_02280 [Bdellovibrionales bacterium RIFCSPHIGHO2_02_FULL_40_15]
MISLALRYLLARRRQTLLTFMGIFLGTIAFVAISGFMLGFREYLIDQLINSTAHVHIQAREDFLSEHTLDKAFYQDQFDYIFWDPPPSGRKDSALVDNPQSWYLRLHSDNRVFAFSPQLKAAAIFSNGKATASSSIVGCDPMEQVKVTTIGDYVKEGSFSDIAAGGNRLAIGIELKKQLGLRLYQNVMVASARSTPTPFKVVAIFQTGNIMADLGAYGSLVDIQKVNHTPNQVNEISVKLHDLNQSARVATEWSKYGVDKVESWDQQNASIFSVFKMQDIIRFLSIGSILIVAGFGIYNVLNMTVLQKRKDVAILRSMGYGTLDIVALFFYQGVLLGGAGALLGVFCGYFVSLYLRTIPFNAGHMAGGISHLIISMNPWIYVQAASMAFFSAIFASILPAYGAGKMQPIEIIRAGAE